MLLQKPGKLDAALIKKYADASGRENFIKTVSLQLMSTPEYQMC
jgi:hypothetical protein